MTTEIAERETRRPPIPERWWVRVLGMYAASRVLATMACWLTYRFAYLKNPNPNMPSGGGFVEFLGTIWDGQWYATIAKDGYPDELPRAADGAIEESPWAFFPLFPMVGRLVMRLTGLPWDVVGPGLSVLLGGAAMLLLFRLVEIAAPSLVAERPALPYTATALMCFFPAAGAFSFAYTDSMALFLVLCILMAIVRRRYLLALVPLLLLGFTRAVALPMAAVVIWQMIHRWRREGPASIARTEWFAAATLAVAAVFSGFVWMGMVGVLLGSSDAYLQAQSAWREFYSTAPFAGWTWTIDTWWGWTLFGCFCVFVMSVVFSPFVRRLGPELQAWGGAYTGYLVATTALGASSPRYLMLSIVFPLILAPSKRGFRDDLVVIGTLAALQIGWIYIVSLVNGVTP